jgi:hypothetical protein
MSQPDNAAPAPVPAHAESPLSKRRSAWLTEHFFDSYVRWREACVEVQMTYQRWDRAERQDRGLAFAAYCAALDREGQAASVHADSADAVREFAGD